MTTAVLDRPTAADRVTRTPLTSPMPAGSWRGWVGPVLAGLVAAVLRIWDLGRPRAIVFDETYYAKDALAMLLFGHEQQPKSKADTRLLDSDGVVEGLRGIFKDDPSYAVHPPMGKWIIATGEHFFGATPFGWRIAVALLGVAAVIMLGRIVRRLTRSNLLGTLAAMLMAIDGVAIVLSRTALLDNSLMFFVLAAFGAIVLDRDRTRKLYPARSWHPWRWVAAALLGLACSVKVSGLWYVLAFCVMVVLWDLGLRRATGQPHPLWRTLIRDAIPSALIMLPIVFLVYLATWYGWFTTDGYLHDWAVNAGAQPGIVSSLRSLAHYHAEAWKFHTNMSQPHNYQSNAWSWPVLGRPTSFYYESNGLSCGSPSCSSEVIALGNPLIWWAAVLALFHQFWRWFAGRDWRAGAVIGGFLAGWMPWLLFQDRTVFNFYSIVFLPFMIMALTMSLGAIMGSSADTLRRRRTGTLAVIAFLLVAVALSWWFYPIWTGMVITNEEWQLRMWLPTWV